MIKEIKMWCIECDSCQKNMELYNSGMIALND